MYARQRKSSGKMAKIRRIYVSVHTRSERPITVARKLLLATVCPSMSYGAHKCKKKKRKNLLSLKVSRKRLSRRRIPRLLKTGRFLSHPRDTKTANVRTWTANDRKVAFSRANCRLESRGRFIIANEAVKSDVSGAFIIEREKERESVATKKGGKKNADRYFSVPGGIFPRLKFRRWREEREREVSRIQRQIDERRWDRALMHLQCQSGRRREKEIPGDGDIM